MHHRQIMDLPVSSETPRYLCFVPSQETEEPTNGPRGGIIAGPTYRPQPSELALHSRPSPPLFVGGESPALLFFWWACGVVRKASNLWPPRPKTTRTEYAPAPHQTPLHPLSHTVFDHQKKTILVLSFTSLVNECTITQALSLSPPGRESFASSTTTAGNSLISPNEPSPPLVIAPLSYLTAGGFRLFS